MFLRAGGHVTFFTSCFDVCRSDIPDAKEICMCDKLKIIFQINQKKLTTYIIILRTFNIRHSNKLDAKEVCVCDKR